MKSFSTSARIADPGDGRTFLHESLSRSFSCPPFAAVVETNKSCELISKRTRALIKLVLTNQSEQKTRTAKKCKWILVRYTYTHRYDRIIDEWIKTNLSFQSGFSVHSYRDSPMWSKLIVSATTISCCSRGMSIELGQMLVPPPTGTPLHFSWSLVVSLSFFSVPMGLNFPLPHLKKFSLGLFAKINYFYPKELFFCHPSQKSSTFYKE